MKTNDVYIDIDGDAILLHSLDAEERRLVSRLRRRARTHPDWTDFDNYWMREVGKFYDARGVPRRVSRESVPVRVAHDLSGRLGLAGGWIEPDDWRGDLEALIRENYPTRKAFCEATGLTPDMLSHVLAGRKDLSLESVTKALEQIGYPPAHTALPARAPSEHQATT